MSLYLLVEMSAANACRTRLESCPGTQNQVQVLVGSDQMSGALGAHLLSSSVAIVAVMGPTTLAHRRIGLSSLVIPLFQACRIFWWSMVVLPHWSSQFSMMPVLSLMPGSLWCPKLAVMAMVVLCAVPGIPLVATACFLTACTVEGAIPWLVKA